MSKINEVFAAILLLFVAFQVLPGVALGQDFQVQVIVDELNVRPSPPRFTLKTLLTFKYQVRPTIAVASRNQILDVHELKSIGAGAEWLRVSYTANNAVINGWVYAGRKGNWVNVRRLESGHQNNNNGPTASHPSTSKLFDFIIPPANAANTYANTPPDDGTASSSIFVFFVIIFNVAVFLGSMFVAKRIKDDVKFLIFSGICTLLIEGVITEAGFWGWIEGII